MHRVWGYITDDLNNEILEIAQREQRKPAAVISILLQQAVKERTRKRNNGKVHIQDYSEHPRQSDTGGQGVLPHSKKSASASGTEKVTST